MIVFLFGISDGIPFEGDELISEVGVEVDDGQTGGAELTANFCVVLSFLDCVEVPMPLSSFLLTKVCTLWVLITFDDPVLIFFSEMLGGFTMAGVVLILTDEDVIVGTFALTLCTAVVMEFAF